VGAVKPKAKCQKSLYSNSVVVLHLVIPSYKKSKMNLYKTEKRLLSENIRIAEFQLHWSTFEKLLDC
jgi:hypothetical protein